MLKGLFKPEYLFQPRILIRRLLRLGGGSSGTFADYPLPWNLTIRMRPAEEHGRMLLTLGVADLVVSEFLWRLSEPGETQVDVGGNIGYMTSILAVRTHPKKGGRVVVFEANPEVYEELAFNVERWRSALPDVEFDPMHMAASSQPGTLKLEMPEDFVSNRGLSRIASEGSSGRTVEVAGQTLDHVLGDRQVGVLKLDVEGHEMQVLEGASGLFGARRVRDCVFEEHRAYPTDVTDYFEKNGYTVMRLHRSLCGPSLLAGDSPIPRNSWHPTNFLATLDEERARRLVSPRGWQVLRC